MTEKTASDKAPDTAQNAPFSIDDWLVDANLPQHSVDLYKAGSIPGEAQALKRQLEAEHEREDVERSAAEVDHYVELEKRYVEVLTRWANSRITVYVSALSKDTFKELREANEKDHAGKDPAIANQLFGYEILSKAIVGIAERGVTYTHEDGTPAPYGPVTLKPNQVRAMERKLGPVQMELLLDARRRAQMEMPEVDADFLHRNSGAAEDDTQG